ncbi:MAG: hypothetical protein JXB00_13885 [Bacteroidales bacterium]|nr:hypothetical protein [Bacteroidales bacterium]
MKRVKRRFILFTILFLSFIQIVPAQENEPVTWLSDFKSDVLAGSYTYRYDFTYFNKELCGITISTVKVDKKGSESESHVELYLTDIDPNYVNFKVTGKYITISLKTKNSQKFIKSYDGGEFKSYVAEAEIYSDQVEKARALVDALKNHLKDCKEQQTTWGSLTECLQWLTANISATTKGSTEYNQEFKFDAAKAYLAGIVRKYNDSKGTEIIEEYAFNLADFNPDKITMIVSGKDLSVDLKTKDDDKYIKFTKNGALQGYDNNFSVLVPDLESARTMVQAFEYAIKESKPEYKNFQDVNTALNYLKENVQDVNAGSVNCKQQFEYDSKPDGIVTFTSITTDSKGVATEEKYHVYLNELDPKVNLAVSGKDVMIKAAVKDKMKLVKTLKNGELQNYTYQFELYAPDIESARELINALSYAIQNRNDGILAWTDTGKATSWLASSTGTVTEGSKTYKQKLAIDAAKSYNTVLQLTTTDSNGDTEESFEFYIPDAEKDKISLEVSGKKMIVNVPTGKEKLVKINKFNQIQNYASSVEFVFDDSKQARNFISAMKYLVSEVKPTGKTFTGNDAAFKYIAGALHSVSTGSYTYDQTLEMIDNDPCKIKLSAVQLDSKNTSTGYIYELNMSDINADAIKLEISGKEMNVTLETKAKQKLIKPFKNGEAQNFTYSLELFTDDVMTARNIISAFKTLAKNCGK